ncbi:glycosyltransferase family 4 protein [Salinicoccus roseus]|uniref:glycosyltransferase family 4 protein n=1 Tax=Salinicoccus roseus TaxID=45670 RepID=UPI0022FFE1B0|nr:glycosyltransferase family 4 protein [Salinicoccus roseus]
MKKMLFITNISKRITNFSMPSMKAAQKLGYEFHMAANFSNFTEDASKYNVKLHHIDLERNPLSFKNLKAYKQMITLLEDEKFDVIHCNTPIGGMLGRLCGKKAKVPKVMYTAHGFHFYEGASLINNVIFKSAEKWMAHYTDTIITMNQEDFQAAQNFKMRKNGKVYFIPGVGVDTKLFKTKGIDKRSLRNSLNIEEEDVVLISMGDLIQRKNYETSIRAIAKVNNPKLQYLICGSGPKLEALQALTKELGIEKQVHFLGFRTDIKELLAIADIFLFTTYQEGLPRSMMEGMAAGLPCVASRVRGNIDLIEEGKSGYLCEPVDVQGFSEAINTLANDKELMKRIGDFNLDKIKMFDTKKIMEKMLEIYKREI